MLRHGFALRFAAVSMLFLTGGLAGTIALQQSTGQNSISFDRVPLGQFIRTMMERLDIAIVLVDGVKLQEPVTLHKDAPVSRQDLLDMFIEGLRANGAVLVKAGIVMSIVPTSRDLGEGFEVVKSLAALVPRRGGNVQMSYNGVLLSDFCAQIADLLNIIPIIIRPAIHGSVTIISSGTTTDEQVYSTLMTVLKNNNASLLESEGKYQIIAASGPLPQGWQPISRQPAPYDRSVRRQRRPVKQEELDSHIVNRVAPAPVWAGDKKLTGRVLLQIDLDERGELDVLHVIQPSVLPLCEAAIEAVRQWRFTPFTGASGSPERVSAYITIVFE